VAATASRRERLLSMCRDGVDMFLAAANCGT